MFSREDEMADFSKDWVEVEEDQRAGIPFVGAIFRLLTPWTWFKDKDEDEDENEDDEE